MDIQQKFKDQKNSVLAVIAVLLIALLVYFIFSGGAGGPSKRSPSASEEVSGFDFEQIDSSQLPDGTRDPSGVYLDQHGSSSSSPRPGKRWQRVQSSSGGGGWFGGGGGVSDSAMAAYLGSSDYYQRSKNLKPVTFDPDDSFTGYLEKNRQKLLDMFGMDENFTNVVEQAFRDPRLAYAVSLEESGRHREAILEYEKLLLTSTNVMVKAVAQSRMAGCYEDIGRDDLAEKCRGNLAILAAQVAIQGFPGAVDTMIQDDETGAVKDLFESLNASEMKQVVPRRQSQR